MKKLLNAEYYYLFKNVRFWVFVGITFFATALFNLVQELNRYQSIVDVVVEIFAIIIIVEFAHKDFKLETMKNYVGSGISLVKVYFGKLIVCLTALIILLFANDIAVTICYTILNKFIISMLGYRLLITFTFILMYSVVFFICSLIRSGSFAVVVSLLYIIALPVIGVTIVPVINIDVVTEIFNFLLYNSQNSIQQVLAGLYYSQVPEYAELIAMNSQVLDAVVYFHIVVETAVVASISVLGAYLFSKKTVR